MSSTVWRRGHWLFGSGLRFSFQYFLSTCNLLLSEYFLPFFADKYPYKNLSGWPPSFFSSIIGSSPEVCVWLVTWSLNSDGSIFWRCDTCCKSSLSRLSNLFRCPISSDGAVLVHTLFHVWTCFPFPSFWYCAVVFVLKFVDAVYRVDQFAVIF